MIFLLTFMLARIRLRLHCFLHLHRGNIDFFHSGDNKVEAWLVECAYCKRVFYKDWVVASFIEAKKKDEEEKKARIVGSIGQES